MADEKSDAPDAVHTNNTLGNLTANEIVAEKEADAGKSVVKEKSTQDHNNKTVAEKEADAGKAVIEEKNTQDHNNEIVADAGKSEVEADQESDDSYYGHIDVYDFFVDEVPEIESSNINVETVLRKNLRHSDLKRMEGLRLLRKYLDKLKTPLQAPADITLTDQSGEEKKEWKMSVVKTNLGLYLREGWFEYAAKHELEIGDTVIIEALNVPEIKYEIRFDKNVKRPKKPNKAKTEV
ncbi:uncharacterized protein LOC107779811 [Nicotiana tabacum]|uniref:Uncharacterized protein LOC107779811 n=1 Tax=Nicotiana tabacum TaxID=4097 RepID=A0A1S3YU87_TOBAC|nr:PREDICTED: uncharacterized protein LOC107779811 [Nicotiana tabacum]